jgi:hypothetical protein
LGGRDSFDLIPTGTGPANSGIHDGRLVEDGTYEELMEKQGYYFRLYQLQFNNNVKGDW